MSIFHEHSSVAEPEDRRAGPTDRRDFPRDEGGRRTTDKRTYTRQHKLSCPFCGFGDSVVISSGNFRGERNPDPNENAYDRPRRCLGCDRIYLTEERIKPGQV
jgi:hypothetical protein